MCPVWAHYRHRRSELSEAQGIARPVAGDLGKAKTKSKNRAPTPTRDLQSLKFKVRHEFQRLHREKYVINSTSLRIPWYR